MSKEKPGKFTLVATHEKFRRGKDLVQVEGELTEAQWNEIVDGLMKLITLYTGFKEELISKQKLTTRAASENSRQHKSFIPMEGALTEAQLEAISGGRMSSN